MRKCHEPATRQQFASGSVTGVGIPMDPISTRRTTMPRPTTMMRSAAWACALLVAATLAPAPAHAKTEIQWWHARQGVLGERVNEIAAKFNASQSDYEIKAVFKGAYPDTLTA